MSNPSRDRRIAVASTFSPRFEQVLAEAKRVRDRFGATLCLIYVGQRDEATSQKFREALAARQLPEDSPVYYQQGDPAEGILRAIQEHDIDMIVAGALEKELVLHPFLGNVARRLVRTASCSVMLFTKPEREPKPLRRIVFLADYSDHARAALKQTFQLASGESCERLHVVRVITTFDQARAKVGGASDEKTHDDEEWELEAFILSAGDTDVPIEARCVRGNTPLAAADFVQSIDADLLVVPVSGSSKDSLPPNLAWLSDVIPCNLWLVR
jgi:nucleotide-binding universal stress UspA family protein